LRVKFENTANGKGSNEELVRVNEELMGRGSDQVLNVHSFIPQYVFVTEFD